MHIQNASPYPSIHPSFQSSVLAPILNLLGSAIDVHRHVYPRILCDVQSDSTPIKGPCSMYKRNVGGNDDDDDDGKDDGDEDGDRLSISGQVRDT